MKYFRTRFLAALNDKSGFPDCPSGQVCAYEAVAPKISAAKTIVGSAERLCAICPNGAASLLKNP
jgi:hypothetical protein